VSHISQKASVRKEINACRRGNHLYTEIFQPIARDDNFCKFIGLQIEISVLNI
jgi:hypothetical protein